MTRPATDIGRGLTGARPARPIVAGERIHVVGAAGAGASAAALLAARAGAAVSGCDPGGPSPYTAALEAAGIPLAWQHSADHVRLDGVGGVAVDRLAVTKALTAIDPDNPELLAAHSLAVPTEPWQQVIADVAATTGQRLVAVAGTHGKSTTAGWLVDSWSVPAGIHLLSSAPYCPKRLAVGRQRPRVGGGAVRSWSRLTSTPATSIRTCHH
jgi:hypothetical protein